MPHRYTDWHPPMMAFLWHYLDMIVRGPILMLVMQVLLWWGGWYLVITVVIRRPLRAALSILALGLWPATGGAVGIILKDMQMATAYIMAFGFILTYREFGSPWRLAAAYVLLFYGTGVRHNAIVAAVPILVWTGAICYQRMRNSRRTEKLLLTIAPGMVVLAGPTLINKSITSSQGHTHVQQMLYVYDLSAISAKTGKILIPPFMLMHPIGVDEISSRYSPISAVPIIFSKDPIVRNLRSGRSVYLLRKAWLNAIVEYPRIYLKHRIDVFRLHLWFGKTPPLLLPKGDIVPNYLGFTWDPSSLSKIYWRIMTLLETHLTYVFRPWIYCVTSLCFMAYALCVSLRRRHFNRHHAAILALTLSGSFYILSYFPLSISAGYRYSLWTMITTFVCLLLLPGAIRERNYIAGPQRLDMSQTDIRTMTQS